MRSQSEQTLARLGSLQLKVLRKLVALCAGREASFAVSQSKALRIIRRAVCDVGVLSKRRTPTRSSTVLAILAQSFGASDESFAASSELLAASGELFGTSGESLAAPGESYGTSGGSFGTSDEAVCASDESLGSFDESVGENPPGFGSGTGA